MQHSPGITRTAAEIVLVEALSVRRSPFEKVSNRAQDNTKLPDIANRKIRWLSPAIENARIDSTFRAPPNGGILAADFSTHVG